MNALQAKVLQRSVSRFIAEDQTDVEIVRVQPALDGLGGTQEGPKIRLPGQPARILAARSRSTDLGRTLPTGQTVASKDGALVGYATMDIRIGDQLEYQGQTLRVSYVQLDRQTMTLAELELLGANARSTI